MTSVQQHFAERMKDTQNLHDVSGWATSRAQHSVPISTNRSTEIWLPHMLRIHPYFDFNPFIPVVAGLERNTVSSSRIL